MALYFKDNAYLREAAKALNILYVYDRVYEPYLINWLFPLQLAFQDGNGEGRRKDKSNQIQSISECSSMC